MPKKRRVSKKKRKSRAKKKTSYLKRWFLQLSVIFICGFLSYCVWLDFQIKKEFEGKRWSVPARVYAEATEVYIGQRYSQTSLVKKLKLLGYKPVKKISGVGQFSSSGQIIELYLREFSYWDAKENARPLRVSFSNNHINDIYDLDSRQAVQIFRLEPVLIGKIFPLHDEDRILIEQQQIPKQLINALIATEDRHFYSHYGIDPIAILRSIYINLRAGKIRQGGSTLTQQLVKNMFLTRERSYSRKINELLMSIMLDYHYSKDQILTAYVNEVFLGQNGARSIHGFGTAAEFYFARPLSELTIDQMALLVGLVKGASYYNPRKHPDRALARRNLVLELMLDQSFISSAQYEKSKKRALQISSKPSWTSARYPAYLDLVRRHLKRDYQLDDLRNEGLRIHTSLNTDIQEMVETSVAKSLTKLDKQTGFKSDTLETAVVLVNQHDGEVQAIIGDRNREQNAFNRAIDAKRPIGSLIKPAIYLTALDSPERYNLLSKLNDTPISLQQGNGKTWSPNNYDRRSHGDVPLIRSLAKSYNLSTVRLGMQVGLDNIINTLRNLGVDSEIAKLPSLLLGSIELSPYQISQMYQTIASGGQQIRLKTVRSVLDAKDKPLKRYDLSVREYIKPQSVFLTQFLLTQVVENGTARRIGRELPSLLPLAGKTGTTNGLRDSWFAGFGDRLLGVVWVGRDDNKPTRLTGSTGAMQVWIDIMKKLKPTPLMMLAPDTIVWKDFYDALDEETNCNTAKAYPFVEGFVPNSVDCF